MLDIRKNDKTKMTVRVSEIENQSDRFFSFELCSGKSIFMAVFVQQWKRQKVQVCFACIHNE